MERVTEWQFVPCITGMKHKSKVTSLSSCHRLFLVLALGGLLGACKKPYVKVNHNPKYPCRGEDVTFTYETKNVDRIRVVDGEGSVVLSTKRGNGSFTIPNIIEAKLPIVATGTQKKKSRTKRIPPDYPLKIIAGPTTVSPYPLTDRELASQEQVSLGTEGCGCTYHWVEEVLIGRDGKPVLNSDGTPKMVKREKITCDSETEKFAVYGYYKAQSTKIPSRDFSSRARVSRVRNRSGYHLTVTRDARSVGDLPPGQAVEFNYSDGLLPWGSWRGEYEPDDLHRVFEGYIVKASRECRGGWYPAPGRVTRRIALELTVSCDE